MPYSYKFIEMEEQIKLKNRIENQDCTFHISNFRMKQRWMLRKYGKNSLFICIRIPIGMSIKNSVFKINETDYGNEGNGKQICNKKEANQY
ncbi:unnamed protein product [Paramecium octaurelia]|uniref:Uncharacterized protein n=1 Tax=Paramecium octaurelia TaxID=43137 RepID=A0A8S1T3K6_PAROT|nr:unnamed protein product [Paramecium octaurelia]